jgi:uncharacterized membrane protein YphA (DoxX/SURF4 family)
MSSYRRLNIVAIFFLVLLRITVGWHFFKEGAVKVQEGSFSSNGFLAGAKGPLADQFHAMIPDYYGLERLDADRLKKSFVAFGDKAFARYGFTAEQKADLDKVVAKYVTQLEELYGSSASEIYEYKRGYERYQAMKNDPKRVEIASLRAQTDEIDSKWLAIAKPLLKTIDGIIEGFQSEVYSLATPSQQQSTGYFQFKLESDTAMSSKVVDKIIPIFDMAIGICLIIGLLTPLAAIAAGFFLTSVVLSQFPGYPGTQPTYFQATEAVACFFLAFSDAGRYAGLDFLSWSWWARRRRDNKPE